MWTVMAIVDTSLINSSPGKVPGWAVPRAEARYLLPQRWGGMARHYWLGTDGQRLHVTTAIRLTGGHFRLLRMQGATAPAY